MRTRAWDLETALIAPGMGAPWLVCLQFCVDDGEPQVIHVRDPACRREIITMFESELSVGQNTAFDSAVVCAQWPDLTPLVFEAYGQDRVTCTTIRAKLIDIAKGERRKDTRYDLGTLAKRFADVSVDKNDPWRLRYAELIDTHPVAWPAEALHYARMDAVATRAVFRGQEQYGEILGDQFRQSRAAFALRLMECWGFAVDGAQAERYIAVVREGLERDRAIAQEHGLVRPDGTKDTKKAMARMVQCALDQGEEIPLTKGGEELDLPAKQVWEEHQAYVSLDEETVEDIGDYVLEAYQRYATAGNRVSRAERLLLAAKAGKPIQASFDPLVRTGRTSCRQGDHKGDGRPLSAYGYQMQNPPRARGQRECFVPRPGYDLIILDFPALESRCWAQECIRRVGFSELADALNAGRDPHTEVGAGLAGLTKEAAYALKGTPGWGDFESQFRFFAKAANFGFPGGMGPARFCVSLVKQAVQSGKEAVISRARAFTIEDAQRLKQTWLDTWPEARLYFEHINELMAGEKSVAVEHWGSKRIRGACTYCQACNAPFQGLGSDIKKECLFQVQREAYADRSSKLYGSRMVNELHDEIILESPKDRSVEAAWRLREIMIEVGERWCPDISFANAMPDPTLCDRWSKDAKSVKDEKGRLTVCHVSVE